MMTLAHRAAIGNAARDMCAAFARFTSATDRFRDAVKAARADGADGTDIALAINSRLSVVQRRTWVAITERLDK